MRRLGSWCMAEQSHGVPSESLAEEKVWCAGCGQGRLPHGIHCQRRQHSNARSRNIRATLRYGSLPRPTLNAPKLIINSRASLPSSTQPFEPPPYRVGRRVQVLLLRLSPVITRSGASIALRAFLPGDGFCVSAMTPMSSVASSGRSATSCANSAADCHSWTLDAISSTIGRPQIICRSYVRAIDVPGHFLDV